MLTYVRNSDHTVIYCSIVVFRWENIWYYLSLMPCDHKYIITKFTTEKGLLTYAMQVYARAFNGDLRNDYLRTDDGKFYSGYPNFQEEPTIKPVIHQYIELDIAFIKMKEPMISFFKDGNGIINSIIELAGVRCRVRSEMLVIKDQSVFLGLDKDGTYKLPGGSIEPNESYIDSAIRETEEEALICVKDVSVAGASFVVEDEPRDWIKKKLVRNNWWRGRCSIICVGWYEKRYKGDIAEFDKDSLAENGKFYPIRDVIKILNEQHRTILRKAMRSKPV